MPSFTIHCAWCDADGNEQTPHELPNILDDFFQGYMFGG
jgi:hypothetical protein